LFSKKHEWIGEYFIYFEFIFHYLMKFLKLKAKMCKEQINFVNFDREMNQIFIKLLIFAKMRTKNGSQNQRFLDR